MSKRETYEAKAMVMLEPIVKANDVEIYDVEYVNEAGEWYLRAYIDKEGGVTIDDCEVVSRAMSTKLDEDDFINEAYILEVSSPGLGRTLKKDRHLSYSIGEEVEVKLFKPVEEGKNAPKLYVGFLKEFTQDTVTIEVPVSEEELTDMVIDRKNIAVIRLTLDF